MRNPARLGKPDANHAQIIQCYQELFCSVLDLHEVGFGCPDLAIGVLGTTVLVEVKTDDGELNPSQERFQRDWRGSKVAIVRTPADVIEHVKMVRNRALRAME